MFSSVIGSMLSIIEHSRQLTRRKQRNLTRRPPEGRPSVRRPPEGQPSVRRPRGGRPSARRPRGGRPSVRRLWGGRPTPRVVRRRRRPVFFTFIAWRGLFSRLTASDGLIEPFFLFFPSLTSSWILRHMRTIRMKMLNH